MLFIIIIKAAQKMRHQKFKSSKGHSDRKITQNQQFLKSSSLSYKSPAAVLTCGKKSEMQSYSTSYLGHEELAVNSALAFWKLPFFLCQYSCVCVCVYVKT